MNVVVELNSGEYTQYDHALLTRVAQETVESSGRIDHSNATLTVSVAFVGEAEIQRINREYRDKDAVTDVISVGDYSDDVDISQESAREIFLGEIILCYNYIASSAHSAGINVDQEFFTVYAHGILHLLGFKHGKEMYELQEKISEKFSSN